MSRPLPYLSDDQQKMVLAALSTLRMSSHDRFLLDLSSALARCPHQPVRDLDVRIAIRQLLGVVGRMEAAHVATPGQIDFVQRAAGLLAMSAQAQFRQQVATLLGYAEHPLHDRTVLDILRIVLAKHGHSISAVLAKPPREYARLQGKKRHDATTNTIL